jgi:hypothetical protein
MQLRQVIAPFASSIIATASFRFARAFSQGFPLSVRAGQFLDQIGEATAGSVRPA